MKIHDLELYLVDVGRGGPSSGGRRLLVRVKGARGLDGWGEAGVPWRTAELAGRREALLAVLAGRSIYDIEELHEIESLTPAPLRSAVEMAVWDLLGHALRQPLCNLWGGYYRRRIPVSVRLTGCRPKSSAQVSRELADQGFHTQTVVTDGRPDDDIKVLAAIRELVGDRIELRWDGRNRFDMETAQELCAELEQQRVELAIDPLNSQELKPMAQLGRQTNVPLCAWRTLRAPSDVLATVRCNAAPFAVIDLDQVGGIVPARACAAIAAAAGVTPLLGGVPSLGIATAAMLHLAAATTAFSAANEMAAGQTRDTVLGDSLEITGGMIAVPEGHGLGVTVDRAKLERRQPA
ncbi:MAG: enolase C-terminal domain-like protein [Thermoguttaceae bacterium]